jgi:hypothetical protein
VIASATPPNLVKSAASCTCLLNYRAYISAYWAVVWGDCHQRDAGCGDDALAGAFAQTAANMTTLTLRRIEDDFLVTGPDIEPMKFNSRREAKDWCRTHYPGSPITEIGANRLKRIVVAAKGRPKWRPENR